ncbi:MAG: putative rane protein [Clostridia bacterium]|jgi:hypothetical protein|nr:putative rane protein [Clostridia bacterium]
MNLEELRLDCAIKQKKGLHFILASIIIWGAVLAIHLSGLPILTKNFLTFCSTAPLMPIAFIISKILKIDFTNKGNPLTGLGIMLSLNQMLYLLIAMWIYPTLPDKMVMVIAIIFGAHLFPFSWLYKSKSYAAMSVLISVSILIVGCFFESYIVALTMIIYEILFSILLIFEMKKINTPI